MHATLLYLDDTIFTHELATQSWQFRWLSVRCAPCAFPLQTHVQLDRHSAKIHADSRILQSLVAPNRHIHSSRKLCPIMSIVHIWVPELSCLPAEATYTANTVVHVTYCRR